ncbi:hypothetical protein AAVH_21384 [Aphelenchoides avenae]|nr:hypothetical protein AAVH_21384 [Aphelenchus avenae]
MSSPQTGAAQTPLDRIVYARKAVYINRFRETTELCAKLQMQRQASHSMTTQACDVAIQAEFLVVSDFIKRSGFLDLLVADTKSICPRIAFSFLSIWNIYEWMLTTIRNFGHHSRRLFFLDESYLDLSEAAISVYYATDSDLLDPWHVGRLGVSSFVDVLEVSRKLARARLDEVESAVLTLILFIRSVKVQICVDGVRVGPLLDHVFRNLALHYRQTYEDYALRLDVTCTWLTKSR